MDVVARLSSRTFAGMESLQLEVRDVAPAGHLAQLRRARQRRRGRRVTPRPPQASRPAPVAAAAPPVRAAVAAGRPSSRRSSRCVGLVAHRGRQPLDRLAVRPHGRAPRDPTRPAPSSTLHRRTPAAAIGRRSMRVTPTPTPHSTIISTPPPDKTARSWARSSSASRVTSTPVTGKGDIKRVRAPRRVTAAYNTAPTWMPDGKRFLFVQTHREGGPGALPGEADQVHLLLPQHHVRRRGRRRPEAGLRVHLQHRWRQAGTAGCSSRTSRRTARRSRWSRDGKDGLGDVTLGTHDHQRRRSSSSSTSCRAVDGQGHNDPAWSPDGKSHRVHLQHRGGRRSARPRSASTTSRTKQDAAAQGGLRQPRPGRRTAGASPRSGRTARGRDIVVLDPRNGAEIARLTNDGRSFAPTFSPNGDQIAFLRRNGLTVDLWLMTLDPANGYTRIEVKPVTDDRRWPGRRVVARLVHPRGPAHAALTPRPDVAAQRRSPAESPTARRRRPPRDGDPAPRPAGTSTAWAPASATTGTVLCLGIDPDPGALPAGVPAPASRASSGSRALLLEAAGPFAAAVKVNVAFFEAWGSDGRARPGAAAARASRRTCRSSRTPSGATSAPPPRASRMALFDALGADAITANPYLGAEAIAPLLDRPDRFVYLLCRTSNPGAGELQGLVVAAGRGARVRPRSRWRSGSRASPATWERHPGTVGLVVGATAPAELAAIRAVAPAPAVPRARAWAPRVVTRRARSASARRLARAAGTRPAAACWSTSRAASRAPRTAPPTPERRSRPRPRRWAATCRC